MEAEQRRINYKPSGNARRLVEELTHLGPQTRDQLAERLDIASGTLRNAIKHLNDSNSFPDGRDAIYGIDPRDAQLPDWIVKKIRGKAGKKPTVLMLHEDAGSVAGIEIGRSHLSVGLADANGRLLGSSRIHEKSHAVDKAAPRDTFAKVAKMVKAQLDLCSISPNEIRGVGVSIPGPVSLKGETLSGALMRSYRGIDIPGKMRAALEKYASISAEVFVENDVDVLGRGEQRYGQAFGLRDVVVVKCSGGIGAAVFSDERLVRGRHGGGAGEIGHCAIKPEALMSGGKILRPTDGREPIEPPCQCGGWGCLEAFAGGDAIVQRILEIEPKKADVRPGGSATAQLDEAISHALAGRKPHKEVFMEAAALVGLAINTLVHLFNPQEVLICGKLSEIGEPFLEAIQVECQDQNLLFGEAKDLIHLGTGSTVEERREVSVGGAIATALRKAPTRFVFSE